MKRETLYLLQIQRIEGALYENIYFEKKRQLDATVELIEKDGFVIRENMDIGLLDKIQVHAMRTFKMIKRVKL